MLLYVCIYMYTCVHLCMHGHAHGCVHMSMYIDMCSACKHLKLSQRFFVYKSVAVSSLTSSKIVPASIWLLTAWNGSDPNWGSVCMHCMQPLGYQDLKWKGKEKQNVIFIWSYAEMKIFSYRLKLYIVKKIISPVSVYICLLIYVNHIGQQLSQEYVSCETEIA